MLSSLYSALMEDSDSDSKDSDIVMYNEHGSPGPCQDINMDKEQSSVNTEPQQADIEMSVDSICTVLRAPKHVRFTSGPAIPFILLSKSEVERTSYKCVPLTEINTMARSQRASSSQTLPLRKPTATRTFDTPWSWTAAATWKEADHPKLPSILMDAFELCAATKSSHAALDSCPCLALVGISWQEQLDCMFCNLHQRFIHGDYLWSHLAHHLGKITGTTLPIFY